MGAQSIPVSFLFFLPCPHYFKHLFSVLKFAIRFLCNTMEKPCGRQWTGQIRNISKIFFSIWGSWAVMILVLTHSGVSVNCFPLSLSWVILPTLPCLCAFLDFIGSEQHESKTNTKINKLNPFILYVFGFWSVSRPTIDHAMLDVPFLQFPGEMPADLGEQLDHTFWRHQ